MDFNAIFSNGHLKAVPFSDPGWFMGPQFICGYTSLGIGNGWFHYDTGSPDKILFRDVDNLGNNMNALMGSLFPASFIYGIRYVPSADEARMFCALTNASPVDMGSYWEITINSVVYGEIPQSDEDGAKWRFLFTNRGLQGIQGIQGNQGIQGIQGIQGEPGETGAPGASGTLVGEIKDFAGVYLPANYLFCDGATLDQDTYPELAKVLGVVYGTTATVRAWTVSITNGSTTITSSSAHGLSVGDPFMSAAMLSCDITNPSTIGANNRSEICYEVVEVMSTTTFRVALPGSTTPVSFTASFSGQSVYTQFKIPDFRGRVTVGRDNMGGTAANRLESLSTDGEKLAETAGSDTHLLLAAESGMPAHTHSVGGGQNTVQRTNTGANTAGIGAGSTGASGPLNASTAHNNLQPMGIVNKIICYQ